MPPCWTGHYQIGCILGYNADEALGVHSGISSLKNNNGLELIYIDVRVQMPADSVWNQRQKVQDSD
ncbi:hypothetical protein [Xenorhabdus mauleonii]|uniref:phage tail fiber protein n=1 Tax=Xenorhabdus mauleonii TaxID=351675 RepID=UPI000B873E50|nr:hypothetical protein [Xenorhabdus mauleonii]